MPLERDDPQQHALRTQHARKLIRIVRGEHIQQQIAARIRDRQVRDAGHGQRQLRCAAVCADERVARNVHAADGGRSPLLLQRMQHLRRVVSLAAAGVEHVGITGSKFRPQPPQRRRASGA